MENQAVKKNGGRMEALRKSHAEVASSILMLEVKIEDALKEAIRNSVGEGSWIEVKRIQLEGTAEHYSAEDMADYLVTVRMKGIALKDGQLYVSYKSLDGKYGGTRQFKGFFGFDDISKDWKLFRYVYNTITNG